MSDDPQESLKKLSELIPRLVRMAEREVGPQEAEELAAEVILTVVRHVQAGRIPEAASVEAWAIGVFKKEASEYKRKTRRLERALPLALSEQAVDNPDPSTWRIEEIEVARLTVEKALRFLPPRQRLILTLRLREFAHEQIADLLGISIDTVDREFKKAKVHLVQLLRLKQ